jgi:hypothetical protein
VTVQNITETIHEHYIELGIVLNDDDFFGQSRKMVGGSLLVLGRSRPSDERQRTVRNGSEREGTVAF